jgi:hypothetical protein
MLVRYGLSSPIAGAAQGVSCGAVGFDPERTLGHSRFSRSVRFYQHERVWLPPMPGGEKVTATKLTKLGYLGKKA